MHAQRNSIDMMLRRGIKTESGCIEWQGHVAKSGYAATSYRRQHWHAHRLMYFLTHGPIAGGMQVMHLCDNRICFNIEHLKLGTPSDNMRDSVSKGRNAMIRKNHCKRGHLYDAKNTYRTKSGARNCRKCLTMLKRKSDLKLKDERARAELK